jgi:N-methylhydantoinase A
VAIVYDRAKLAAGNRIPGPAIVMEMDSTTVILPKHHGRVDEHGNILIYPDGYRVAARKAPAKARRATQKSARRPK